MEKHKSSIYFLLVTIAGFFFASSPTLFSHGMFMDGAYYATISRNLSEGLGSFWSPQFTETLSKEFYDHPPLVFFLQSIFFNVFGDHHWVERLYSLVCYFITGGLIIAIWKQLHSDQLKTLYWLPILLWLTVPKMIWGASNNLLENTMMVFILSSILCQIIAFKTRSNHLFFFAGFFLFLGFLSKGFTTFFPLSFPFFYFLFFQKKSYLKLSKIYVYFLVGIIIPFALMFLLFPQSLESLQNYLKIQIFSEMGKALANKSRFYIIRRVSEELLPMVIVCSLILIIKHFFFKKIHLFKENKSWILVLLATALSGVLPILVSLKQSTFYVIATFPLFAITASLVIASIILCWVSKINTKSNNFIIFKYTSCLLLFASVFVLLLPIHKIRRDQKKIRDIQKVIAHIGKPETIGIDISLTNEWSYHAYFYRYGYISLTGEKPETNRYIISYKGIKSSSYLNFKKVDLGLLSLDLYRNIAK